MENRRVEFKVSVRKPNEPDDQYGRANWIVVTDVDMEVNEMQAAAVTAEILRLLSDASVAE